MMVRDRTFLVGIDDSEATLRTVSYVADTLGPQKGFYVVLLHVLPPIPPELLEFGGSEDPQTEQRLDAELKKDQAQWIEQAKQAANPLVEKVKGIFLRVGISAGMITTVFAESIHRPDFVRELLETAHKQNCGTIVVGRESYPSFKEMFHHHVGEELVRKGQGFAIWVVE
ncbi:MAG: universal stress protein [Nitrospirota bacterium]